MDAPEKMIESVLERARQLNMDDDVRIILLHGDPNENNALGITGPFEVEDAASHVDEEFLAGAAIVFEDAYGDVMFRQSRCYCGNCLAKREEEDED